MQRHLRSTSISFSKYNYNFSWISSYFNFVVFLSNIPLDSFYWCIHHLEWKKIFSYKKDRALITSVKIKQSFSNLFSYFQAILSRYKVCMAQIAAGIQPKIEIWSIKHTVASAGRWRAINNDQGKINATIDFILKTLFFCNVLTFISSFYWHLKLALRFRYF